jgi:hypothetical protein
MSGQGGAAQETYISEARREHGDVHRMMRELGQSSHEDLDLLMAPTMIMPVAWESLVVDSSTQPETNILCSA